MYDSIFLSQKYLLVRKILATIRFYLIISIKMFVYLFIKKSIYFKNSFFTEDELLQQKHRKQAPKKRHIT